MRILVSLTKSCHELIQIQAIRMGIKKGWVDQIATACCFLEVQSIFPERQVTGAGEIRCCVCLGSPCLELLHVWQVPRHDLVWSFWQHADLSSAHVSAVSPASSPKGTLVTSRTGMGFSFIFQPQASKISCSSFWQLPGSWNGLSPCFCAEGFKDLSKDGTDVNTRDWLEPPKTDQNTWQGKPTPGSALSPGSCFF